MISERIKKARKQLDITQKKLAELAGIPITSHKDYEGGKSKPGGDALAGYAKLDININWLLTGKGTMFVNRNEIDPEIMDYILKKLISAEQLNGIVKPLSNAVFEQHEKYQTPDDIPSSKTNSSLTELKQYFVAEYILAGHIYNNVCHINNKASRERKIDDQIDMINVARKLQAGQ